MKVVLWAMVLALLVSLSACTTAVKPSPAAGYPFIHKDFDLSYAWKTEQTDQGLRVDGLIKNVRYPRMESLEVDVELLDPSRKTIAKGVYFPAGPIDQDDYRSFEVVLKNARVSEGDLLLFLVKYVGWAASNTFNWTSSFTVNAKTGKPVGVGRVPEVEW